MSEATRGDESSAYWRWLAIASVAVLVLVGYVDLKVRLTALEAPGTEPAVLAATAAADASVGDASPPDEPALGPCMGMLTEEEVRQTVGRHGRSVFACYEQARVLRPELAGTIELRLRVVASGAVETVQIRGTFQDDQLLACLQDAIRQWRFPSPHDGDCALVSAPFSLRPPETP